MRTVRQARADAACARCVARREKDETPAGPSRRWARAHTKAHVFAARTRGCALPRASVPPARRARFERTISPHEGGAPRRRRRRDDTDGGGGGDDGKAVPPSPNHLELERSARLARRRRVALRRGEQAEPADRPHGARPAAGARVVPEQPAQQRRMRMARRVRTGALRTCVSMRRVMTGRCARARPCVAPGLGVAHVCVRASRQDGRCARMRPCVAPGLGVSTTGGRNHRRIRACKNCAIATAARAASASEPSRPRRSRYMT